MRRIARCIAGGTHAVGIGDVQAGRHHPIVYLLLRDGHYGVCSTVEPRAGLRQYLERNKLLGKHTEIILFTSTSHHLLVIRDTKARRVSTSRCVLVP